MNLISIVLLFCFFTITQSKLEGFSKEIIDLRISLAECILQATNKFNYQKFDVIIYSRPIGIMQKSPISLDAFLLPKLSSLGVSVGVVNNPKIIKSEESMLIYHPRIYLVHFATKEDLNKQVDKFKELMILNPHAQFLFVSTAVFDKPHEIAFDLSNYLWKENVLNFYILLPRSLNITTFIIITWNAYKNGKCGDPLDKASYRFNTCSFGKTTRNMNWFNNRLPQKFGNCPIKVKYVVNPPYIIEKNNQISGLEIDMLKIIGEKLNLNFEYEKSALSEMGEVSKYGQFKGVFNDLNNKSADIAIGGYSKQYLNLVYFDTSQGYTQDALIFCVPDVPFISYAEYMIHFISYKCLLMIIVLHVAVSSLISILSTKDQEEHVSYKKFKWTTFNLLNVLRSSNISILPKTSKVRYLLMNYIIYSYLLTTIMNSVLVSYSTTKNYKRKYNSFDDIYNSKLKTYFFDIHRTILRTYGSGEALAEIEKRYRSCKNLRLCLHYVNEDKDASLCINDIFRNYIASTENGVNLYCIKRDTTPYSVNFVMRKGFPLTNRIKQLISRLQSAGFISKWKTLHAQTSPESDGLKVITREKFGPIFYLYGILIVAAIITFIIELICGNKNCHVYNYLRKINNDK